MRHIALLGERILSLVKFVHEISENGGPTGTTVPKFQALEWDVDSEVVEEG
jgi:hypothetical protein